MKSRLKTILLVAVLLLVLFGLYVARPFLNSGPVRFEDPVEHFKYGSLGADTSENGIPYWIFQVLPEMFPEHLPQNGREGWAALGLVVEEGREVPVGFSQRRQSGIKLVGMNCAVCHATTFRETRQSSPELILGIAHTFDFGAWLQFLFNCANDERFSVENVMAAIDEQTNLGPVEKFLYRRAVPQFKKGVREQKAQLSSLLELAEESPFGPGRVDVLGPLRALMLDDPLDPETEQLATVDFPSIWNQDDRVGMNAHWDGNNSSLRERNFSATLGVGATPDSVDLEAMARVEEYTNNELTPRPYPPERIDQSLAEEGEAYYDQHCASCHSLDGKYIGEVEPLDEIGTDPLRTTAADQELVSALNSLGEGQSWAFSHFEVTDGYVNMPLDGIWLRSPYLHNGSVPTLWHLLQKPEDRPDVFSRGANLYDWENVGWEWRKEEAEAGGNTYFDYDTALPGNGNSGHLYGTELPSDQKEAIIEYMKTL